VLVTGATGYIGGRLVPRLLEAGHRVKVVVRTPTRLTKDQRRLLQQLAEISPQDNRPEEKSVFEKVKDYFS